MKYKKDPAIFFEEEMQWRQEQSQRDTGKEISETMSYEEAKDMLAPLMENRIDQKKSFDKEYRRIMRIAKNHYAPDTFEYDFLVDCLWTMTDMKDDVKCQGQLNELERYWLLNEARKSSSTNTYHDSHEDFNLLIADAKNVEIEKVCSSPCKKSGARTLVTLCPFHTEKTPSFTIFTNTNTFYCFGCGVTGDAITFYQKLYGVDFVESVRRLTGRYV